MLSLIKDSLLDLIFIRIHASSDCNISVPIQRRSYWHNHRRSGFKSDAVVRVLCQVKLEDDVDDGTCELVNGVELVLGEGQDSIRAYLLKAVKNNNGTGILLLSDIFGFENSSTRDFAYRVACNGYKYVFFPHYVFDIPLLLSVASLILLKRLKVFLHTSWVWDIHLLI